MWGLIIRARHVNIMLPALDRTVDAFVGARRPFREIASTPEAEGLEIRKHLELPYTTAERIREDLVALGFIELVEAGGDGKSSRLRHHRSRLRHHHAGTTPTPGISG